VSEHPLGQRDHASPLHTAWVNSDAARRNKWLDTKLELAGAGQVSGAHRNSLGT
jgi:hypothetical protein